ncbi:MAG: hypothetical protein IJ033_05985 [Clostridia bacterium]|nr:hypothetical protein [Clostridia bacterium]
MKKRITLLIVCLLLIGTIFTLVACNEAEGLYKPTNITYDGTYITWDPVALAEHYTVQINGGEAQRVNTNLFSYDSQGAEFEAVVSAVIGNQSLGETIKFIPLQTISSLAVANNGEVSWSSIPEATAYLIQVNGETLPSPITDTRYQAPVGNSRIKIRPVVSGDNSYYSLWSAEKQVMVNSAPTSINYDGETITWLGNASKYEVTIAGVPQIVTGNRLVYASDRVDFTAQVKALGDYTYSYDSAVAEETFRFLAPATGFSMSNGVLNWTAVENAEGYKIRINNVIQNKTTTEAQYDKLTSGTALAVEIMPYNNSGKYYSLWSETQDIYILDTPVVAWNSDLELDGQANNNFTWNAVNGAIAYNVEVDYNGAVTKETFPATQMAFAHAYSQVGTYKIRVQAVADNNERYDSKFNNDIIVERLEAPRASTNDYIVSDANNVQAGFTVNYTSVAGATSYQLYKDGVLLEGKSSTALAITDNHVIDDATAAEQHYTYHVRSMGGVKTVSNTTYVYLPCLTADALYFDITVLAMPTNVTMAGFNAEWSAVNGANGYAVKYDGDILNSNNVSYDMSILSAGSHDLYICAKGNGSSTLSSNYTAPLTITRLDAPTNIKISYGDGEGLLEYKDVSNAKGYMVHLDHNSQSLDSDAWDNMYQYISENGTVLHMIAVANYYNELGTIYYMTSEASPTQQFIRLSSPTFADGAFANSKELVWNAPQNINTQEYTPTYEVYDESDTMLTGGVQNATKFNIEYLQGGATYTFRVKAVGNNTKYLDSEKSVSISIYKLSTPTLSIVGNDYSWNSVTNASAYVLEIDGVRVTNDFHVSGSTYTHTPKYTSTGNHTVKLYALGDGYQTINSDTFNYTQVVSTCISPEISFRYSDETVVNGGSIIVNITTPSENCTKYQYEIAGSSITSANLTESKVIESAGTYYVKVKALGGTIVNDVYYLDSVYAGGSSGYSITLLSAPTLASFSINSDGAVKWATITGCSGYDYQISYNGESYTSIAHTATASLDPISNFRDYRTISIRVRACGNGTNTITSTWIEYTWTNSAL